MNGFLLFTLLVLAIILMIMCMGDSFDDFF